LTAILYALQDAPRVVPVKIISEAHRPLHAILTRSPRWEDIGWIGVEHSALYRAIISQCRARSAPTRFLWSKVSPQRPGAVHAAALAALGAQAECIDTRPPYTISRFLPSGAKISALFQTLLYKGIYDMAHSLHPPRRHTEQHLTLTKAAVKAHTGLTPTSPAIWAALRSRTNDRRVQVFLWKLLHHGYRCGEWWTHITGFEDRARCPHCDTQDSMTHILTACTANGQSLVWSLVRALMARKPTAIPAITIGSITGINLIHLHDTNERPLPGSSRLLHIAVAESAYLIWKLRCERVVGHSDDLTFQHTPESITNKWMNTINRRLTLDIALTHPKLPTSKRIPAATVLATWSGTLDHEDALPENWLHQAGVLVGRP
ncbi:hypothetical protein BDW22DRAFT_1313007, partial [Trametopsis cervina]